MTNAASLVNDALAALTTLAPAERLFRAVLRRNRNHVPSLNLLTAVLMSQQRFA